MEKLTEITSKMLELTHEISSYKSFKKKVREEVEKNKDNPEALKAILKGKTRRELIDSYNLYILQLLSYLDYYNQEVALFVGGPRHPIATAAKPVAQPAPVQVAEVKAKPKLLSFFKKKVKEEAKQPEASKSVQPVLPAVSISTKSMSLVSPETFFYCLILRDVV